MLPFYENRVEDFVICKINKLDFLPHLHAQLELLYVEEGEMEISIGGCTQILKAGDLSICFPNCVHSYHTPAGHMQCVLMIINQPLAGDHLSTLLKFRPKDPFVRCDRLHRDIPYAIHTLLEEYDYTPDHPVCSPICKAYAHIIISRLLQTVELTANKDGSSFDAVCRIIRYIDENYSQPISLKDLAKTLGVSRYHISRIFSDKIGVHFCDYLNGIRVYFARGMLSNGEQSITLIAYECGFQSIRTFNRAFVKMYKVSPREYRRCHS